MSTITASSCSGSVPDCQAAEGARPVPLAAFLVSAAAFLSAFLGGVVALRAVSRVGIIIAIGAGIRIGAAFFDLIPEAVDLVGSLDQVMVATAFGFLAFYVSRSSRRCTSDTRRPPSSITVMPPTATSGSSGRAA